MNKIINIMLLGLVGIFGGIFVAIIYIIGLIFLLLNEIAGGKKFKKKLQKLNNMVKDEFKEILDVFKHLDRV